jgi:hypothetical protein
MYRVDRVLQLDCRCTVCYALTLGKNRLEANAWTWGKTTIKNANEDMLCSEMLYTMEIVLDPFGSLTTITNSSAG